VDAIKSIEGRFTAPALVIQEDRSSNNYLSIARVGENWTPQQVHKHLRGCVDAMPGGKDIQIKKVTKGGKGLFFAEFLSAKDAEAASDANIWFGKVFSVGTPSWYYYRVTYYADEISTEDEDIIIAAVKDLLGLDAVSVSINVEKKCATIYYRSPEDWSCVLTEERAEVIPIYDVDGKTSYYLHISRPTAHTNDPNVPKMQMTGLPQGTTDIGLLEGLRTTLRHIIPRSAILAAAIYRYTDSNKQARFGFLHVQGGEAMELLEKVEIPFKGEFIHFQKAVEKRRRDEDE